MGVDLHGRHQPAEAIRVIRKREPYDPWFAETPEATEEVARAVRTPIALGEEWRTAYDAKLRFERRCPAIVRPEMGHTGATEFLRIAALADAAGIGVMRMPPSAWASLSLLACTPPRPSRPSPATSSSTPFCSAIAGCWTAV